MLVYIIISSPFTDSCFVLLLLLLLQDSHTTIRWRDRLCRSSLGILHTWRREGVAPNAHAGAQFQESIRDDTPTKSSFVPTKSLGCCLHLCFWELSSRMRIWCALVPARRSRRIPRPEGMSSIHRLVVVASLHWINQVGVRFSFIEIDRNEWWRLVGSYRFPMMMALETNWSWMDWIVIWACLLNDYLVIASFNMVTSLHARSTTHIPIPSTSSTTFFAVRSISAFSEIWILATSTPLAEPWEAVLIM